MTQTEQKPKRSIAEWVTFGISSLILAIIVSLVGYTWLNEKNQPPILSVTKKEIIREINGQFYVSFEVVNSGGDTAESVQIMAELVINGKVTETGEQQIDFLSSGESEEGAFIFSKNPRQGELNMRVGSYKLP
ncbi:TIGR02588 family protein [Nostoc sp. 'Peltigera membranacea cyanobiont' 213]|uniref:TIGR02588 family protein n=1 Tax=unclassified Nostoc TaxID=2593658 RepID=UPI000B95C8EE|nr:TIGR02588 family protein [Nostoc sp. 'Peltigera membranacea cyanobiont' 213]OYD88175.1 TIGR02588 family protein [Nostoc sp. 'Peltigera membranacea cyanobiont' 213]